jgi:nitrogen fixation/metabolism regulation signal transduction histidine kinase
LYNFPGVLMLSTIGLRAWSIILSLVILAVGLTAVTGINRLSEQTEDALESVRLTQMHAEDDHAELTAELKARIAILRNNVRNWSVAGAAVTFLGLVLTLVFYYSTSEVVISPLDRIAKVIDRVNAGDTSLRIPEESVGAVRRLSRSCNRLLEHFEKLLDEGRSQVNRRQRQTLTLIEAFDEPVVLADDAGKIVLSNTKARDFLTGKNASDEIEQALIQAVKEKRDVDCVGVTIRHLNNKDDVRQVLVFRNG